MSNRIIGFLIKQNNNSLIDAIEKVENFSTQFCNNWISKNLTETDRISAEVGKYLDHIHGEILRHRDENKIELLSSRPFAVALNEVVGKIHEPASNESYNFFMALEDGKGAFAPDAITTPLTLENALNKIKHRGTQKFNFKIKKPSNHKIYLYTNGNSKYSDSIVSITMSLFCTACRNAAKCI